MGVWTEAFFDSNPQNLPPNQFMNNQFLTKIDAAVPDASNTEVVFQTLTFSQLLNEYLSAYLRAGSPFDVMGAKIAGTGEGISWKSVITNPKAFARLTATAVAKGLGEKILPELAKWFGIAFGEFFFRTFPYAFAFTFSLILLALPFIVLTMMLPEGLYVFVSYIRGLVWVMSWLPFAILVYHIGNLYYDSMLPATAVSALVQGGVATGEAFRQLTDDADLAMAMMGFFLTSIPFITYVIFARGIIGELGTRIGGAVGSALGGAMATGYVVQRGLSMVSRAFGGRAGAGASEGEGE